MEVQSKNTGRIRRILGIFFGIATQIVFAITAIQLFLFLRDGGGTESSYWWIVDTALAIAFTIPHSVLLQPRVKKALLQRLHPAFYGSFFCLITCGTLLGLFHFWQTCSVKVWDLEGNAKAVIQCAYYLGWASLIYSIHLTGLGYQTGLTPWWYWVRSQPEPRRPMVVKGAYRLLRHPVYASFLMLLWFNPSMTLDHAALTGIWTTYVFVGSIFKDARLRFYIKDAYCEYQSRVPGYPVIGWGSLARVPFPIAKATTIRDTSASEAA